MRGRVVGWGGGGGQVDRVLRHFEGIGMKALIVRPPTPRAPAAAAAAEPLPALPASGKAGTLPA